VRVRVRVRVRVHVRVRVYLLRNVFSVRRPVVAACHRRLHLISTCAYVYMYDRVHVEWSMCMTAYMYDRVHVHV